MQTKCKISDVQISSIYNKRVKKPTLICGITRTKQSFAQECDINNIIKRFTRTGVLDFTNKNEPRYGDCTGIEYNESMQIVANAKSLFNELPAHLRDRFDNEPALFLDFVHDEKNREEAEKLGLLNPRQEESELPARDAQGRFRDAPDPTPPGPDVDITKDRRSNPGGINTGAGKSAPGSTNSTT